MWKVQYNFHPADSFSIALLAVRCALFVPVFHSQDRKMSECIDDMEAFTKLTDSVFHQILLSKDSNLAESQHILNNIMTRKLYKCVGQSRPFQGFTADCVRHSTFQSFLHVISFHDWYFSSNIYLFNDSLNILLMVIYGYWQCLFHRRLCETQYISILFACHFVS